VRLCDPPVRRRTVPPPDDAAHVAASSPGAGPRPRRRLRGRYTCCRRSSCACTGVRAMGVRVGVRRDPRLLAACPGDFNVRRPSLNLATRMRAMGFVSFPDSVSV
jgi:hypothetical protein